MGAGGKKVTYVQYYIYSYIYIYTVVVSYVKQDVLKKKEKKTKLKSAKKKNWGRHGKGYFIPFVVLWIKDKDCGKC